MLDQTSTEPVFYSTLLKSEIPFVDSRYKSLVMSEQVYVVYKC